MSEIKPCPWCQREPHVSDCGMPENKDDLYAWCLTDGCANQQKVYKLTAWNRRAAPEPAPGDRERAEALAERIYALRGENFILGAHKGGDCYRETCDCIANDLAAEFASIRALERERIRERFSRQNNDDEFSVATIRAIIDGTDASKGEP